MGATAQTIIERRSDSFEPASFRDRHQDVQRGLGSWRASPVRKNAAGRIAQFKADRPPPPKRMPALVFRGSMRRESMIHSAREEGTLAQLKALELEHLRPGAACDIAQPPLATRCRQNLIKLDREALF